LLLLLPPFATDEDGFGAVLGRLLLFGRLLFEAVRLFPFPADGLGAAATGPRAVAPEGREVMLEEGLGLLLAESGFLATFEEGLGALEGPLALPLLLFEGLTAGRGAGAEEILGALPDELPGRGAGRASGFRLLLLLLLATGR